MNKIRVAINGFGRIGRLTTRNLLERFADKVEIVAVNDLTSSENLAYLFENDTIYGKFNGGVSFGDNVITINGNKISVSAEKDPSQLPWKENNIDVVLECTGRFLTKELASKHIEAGAKKVVLSAPAKSSDILTIVQGVNVGSIHSDNADYPDQDKFISENIVSNASCTTNCISPVLKVIESEFGIESGQGITVHAYTTSQNIQDGPSRKNLRIGRSAPQNMIPTTTGAAKATFLVLPELTGKISLSALRVPVATGSMVYINLNLKKDVTAGEINSMLEQYSQNELKGILEYSTKELVSSDIIHNSHSSIVDSQLTEVSNGNLLKLVVWYDNEWGYSSRLAESILSL